MDFRIRTAIGMVLVTLSYLSSAQGPAQQPWPDVTLTTRDYTGNVPATDRCHYPVGHPAVEKSPTSAVNHVVYTRGSNIQLSVIWRNDNDFALSGTVTWQAARLRVPGPNNNPAEQYINLNVSGSHSVSMAANGGTTAPVPLTITGVPNYVAVGQLEIKFDMPLTKAPGQRGNNGTQGNFHGWERIPLIDSTPIGTQAMPWADLCEYSCRWAFGYSGFANVRRELTRGLHYSSRAPWNRTKYVQYGRTYYFTYGGPFYFSSLLSALSDPWLASQEELYVSMNCHEYAAVLFLALQGHGIPAATDALYRGVTWWTWPGCPAGLSGLNWLNYRKYEFDEHHVVRSEGMRFDAAISLYYDYEGALWLQPVTEWPVGSHWQNVVILNNVLYWFGLCFGNDSVNNVPVQEVINPSNAQPGQAI